MTKAVLRRFSSWPMYELELEESGISHSWPDELPADATRVQVRQSLEPQQWKRMGKMLAARPDVTLRVYGGTSDLEFLQYLPELQRFQVDCMYRLDNIDGLRFLPDELKSLTIGAMQRRMSLNELRRFKGLGDLLLEGNFKDIEAISSLTELRELTLRSVTLPDLSLLLPMQQLSWLALKLGGTKNLDLLPQIGVLEYLEIWMVRGLSDLSAISDVTSLRYLHLESLKHVTHLPSMTGLEHLEYVLLQNLESLKSIDELAHAPALRGLLMIDMGSVPTEAYTVLRDHPTLRQAQVGTGSMRRNNEIEHLLGLPGITDWPQPPYG